MLSPSDCHPAGPYVAGGPVGPDGTLSTFFSDHAGPAGRHVAVGPFGMPSQSDCYPAGPCVAGGPVGPDGMLSPFTSDPAGLAGRQVAVSPVGRLPQVLRYWWTLVGVYSFRGREDQNFDQVF